MRQQHRPTNDARRDARTGWPTWGVLAWSATLALHLGVLDFMLRAPTPLLFFRKNVSPAATEALQVRFIETTSVPPARSRTIPKLAPPPRQPAPAHASIFPAPKTIASTKPASPPPSAPVAPPARQHPTPVSGYVEGGRDFAQRLGDAGKHTVRLPGEISPHATRFRMSAPAVNGLHLVADILKGLGGGEDAACLHAESADGLTPQQQLAQGMSIRNIKRDAARHGCISLDRLRTMQEAPMALKLH